MLTKIVNGCGWLIICIGRLLSWIFPIPVHTKHFFFLRTFCTGGAQKVHLDIAKALKDVHPVFIFTNKSINQHFLDDFRRIGPVYQPNRIVNHITKFPAEHLIIGYWSSIINRSENSVVFIGNSPFGYRIVPYLKAERIVDIIHAASMYVQKYWLPVYRHLDKRVFIIEHARKWMLEQYPRLGISKPDDQEFVVISNVGYIDEKPKKRTFEPPLKVVFVGRNGREKRVHLYFEIAKALHPRIKFSLIGPFEEAIPEVHNYGLVLEQNRLHDVVREHDVILCTSSSEGFPLTIMDAMGVGVAPVTTDVGGIPDHIRDHQNGILIRDREDEDGIVHDFVTALNELASDRALLERLSENGYRYARDNFSVERFNRIYRDILLSGRADTK